MRQLWQTVKPYMNVNRYFGPDDNSGTGIGETDTGEVFERTELRDFVNHLLDLSTPAIIRQQAIKCPPYNYCLTLLSNITAKKICEGEVESPMDTVYAERFNNTLKSRVGFDGFQNKYQYFKYMTRQLLIERYIISKINRRNNGYRLWFEKRGDITLERDVNGRFFFRFSTGDLFSPEGVFFVTLQQDLDLYRQSSLSTTAFYPEPSYKELAEEILTVNVIRAYIRKYMRSPFSPKLGAYHQMDSTQRGTGSGNTEEDDFVDSHLDHIAIPTADDNEIKGFDGLMGYPNLAKVLQDASMRIYRTLGLSPFMTAEDQQSERGSGVKHMAVIDAFRTFNPILSLIGSEIEAKLLDPTMDDSFTIVPVTEDLMVELPETSEIIGQNNQSNNGGM